MRREGKAIGAGLLSQCLRGAFRLLPALLRAPLLRRVVPRAPDHLRGPLMAAWGPLVPAGQPVPIARGPLSDALWIADSSLPSCLLGVFAAEVQDALARTVKSGTVFYDIGANVGYFTLLGSRLVGPAGRVVAFEPLPEALELLRRHVELNGCANVDVHEVALADEGGTARFVVSESNSMGRLDPEGEIVVEVVRLDDVALTSGSRPPSVMKVDVEGSEAAVLRGAPRVLAEARPAIVLATHGFERRTECLALFAAARYRVTTLRQSGKRDETHRAELLATP